jgi:hypothetical protein
MAPTRGHRSGRRFVVRGVLALLWLGAAALISLGAAGMVASVGGPPGGGGRPELTWAGDAAIAPALDAAQGDLAAIADQVDALAQEGRLALAALAATDLPALQRAVGDGSVLAETIGTRVRDLAARVAALPALRPDAALFYGTETSRRQQRLLTALAAAGQLPSVWSRFSGGAAAAAQLTDLLAAHDRQAGAAAALGRAGRYADALRQLEAAAVTLDAARRLRDQLANAVDVSVLDAWIGRNATYDAALRTLYLALAASGGRVTSAVREALAAEQAARAQLPPDTRGLVVILSEVARGGMNQSVIAIEEVRGTLAAVLGGEASGPIPTAGSGGG